MKENMRLSIIIPVYNAEKYIKNCLDSLLRQNVGGIEILCIYYVLMMDQLILPQK